MYHLEAICGLVVWDKVTGSMHHDMCEPSILAGVPSNLISYLPHLPRCLVELFSVGPVQGLDVHLCLRISDYNIQMSHIDHHLVLCYQEVFLS